jgi:hypothetical protein
MDSDNATRNAGMRHQMRIYTWEEVEWEWEKEDRTRVRFVEVETLKVLTGLV